MRILDIVAKDLRQLITDWRTPVFLVIMPIVGTIFFGIAFAESGEVDARVPVTVIDHDSGMISAWITQAVEASGAVRAVEVDATNSEELKPLILDETLAAALIIPAGYREATLARAALTSGGPELGFELWYDPGSHAGQAARNELQAILMRGRGAIEVGAIAARVRASQQAFEDDAAHLAFAEAAAGDALAAWDAPPFMVETRMAVQGEEEEQGFTDTDSYAQSSPGMMIQFGIAGIMGSASLVVMERKSKTLQRLLTTSIRRSEIIAAKLLSGFIQIFAQILLLATFGQLLYNLPYYNHPLAFLLLSSVFALAISSMGLLIGALAPTDEAVVIMVLIPMFLLSALGGAWLPLEFMPEGMRLAGRIATPTAWVMEGFQDIIVRGQGLEAVWLPAAIVAAWALVFFILAAWRLRVTG